MPRSRFLIFATIVLALASDVRGGQPNAGSNEVTVRGRQQNIYFYPAKGPGQHRKVLFAPGDRGCRGFAITITEEFGKDGYDAYCFDTRRYLESFTGAQALHTADVASDFAEIARWIQQDEREPIVFVGWSEGAGLGLVATAVPANQAIFAGLIAIGTPQENILAWHWSDITASIMNKVPHEPTFNSVDFMSKVSPLPLFMIASTSDEYISTEATQALFAAARDPKRLAIIKARDHKYSGNTDEFFRTLREGLNWIEQQHR